MKFIPAKCPFCKGELQIPDDKEHIICMYCGEKIKVSKVIKKVSNIIHPPPPPPPPPLEVNSKLKGEGITKYDKKGFNKSIIIIIGIVIVILIIAVMRFVNEKNKTQQYQNKK